MNEGQGDSFTPQRKRFTEPQYHNPAMRLLFLGFLTNPGGKPCVVNKCENVGGGQVYQREAGLKKWLEATLKMAL